jgi:hypothetical protein
MRLKEIELISGNPSKVLRTIKVSIDANNATISAKIDALYGSDAKYFIGIGKVKIVDV